MAKSNTYQLGLNVTRPSCKKLVVTNLVTNSCRTESAIVKKVDDGDEIEKEDGNGRGIVVNFRSRTHGFTPHPYGIFLGLAPKSLTHAAKRSSTRKTQGKL